MTSNDPHQGRLLDLCAASFAVYIDSFSRDKIATPAPTRLIRGLTQNGYLTITGSRPNTIILKYSAIISINNRIFNGPRDIRSTGQVLHTLSNTTRRIRANIYMSSNMHARDFISDYGIAFFPVSRERVSTCATAGRPCSGTNTCTVRNHTTL